MDGRMAYENPVTVVANGWVAPGTVQQSQPYAQQQLIAPAPMHAMPVQQAHSRSNSIAISVSNEAEKALWKTGLCSCCDAPGGIDLCIEAFMCPCVIYGRNAAKLKESEVLCGSSFKKSCGLFCCLNIGFPILAGVFLDGGSQCLCLLSMCCCCSCCIHTSARRAIRLRYNIVQDKNDMVTTCLCMPCVLIQESNELKLHSAGEDGTTTTEENNQPLASYPDAPTAPSSQNPHTTMLQQPVTQNFQDQGARLTQAADGHLTTPQMSGYGVPRTPSPASANMFTPGAQPPGYGAPPAYAPAPGYMVTPQAPGYGAPTASGYYTQAPGYMPMPQAHGYGQPSAAGYTQMHAPGYMPMPQAPGYGQPSTTGYTQMHAPGYMLMPQAPGYGQPPAAYMQAPGPIAIGYRCEPRPSVSESKDSLHAPGTPESSHRD